MGGEARGPDFIIIGAMKCATSTLHEQLARQPGIFMTEPKEPNFFSDDEVYERGVAWYASLFGGADPALRCGESSTHYTKLPTHPETIRRMREHLPAGVRFVYVMRHPIDRLISQYVHEWTCRRVDVPIDEAVEAVPELVAYGRYAMQMAPFLSAFGTDAVLPVFFERLTSHPQEQLERVGAFIGAPGAIRWDETLRAQNASHQRERSSGLRETLKRVPGLRTMLRAVVPAPWWEGVKTRLWRMDRRPELDPKVRERLEAVFDEDLAELGRGLGIELDCRTFKSAVDRAELSFGIRTPTEVVT